MASSTIDLFSWRRNSAQKFTPVQAPKKGPRPLLRLRSALTQAGRDLDGLEREVKIITVLNFGSKKEKARALADLFVTNLSQAQQGLPPELIKGCERLSGIAMEIKRLLVVINRGNYASIQNSVQGKISSIRKEIRSVTGDLEQEMAREAA